jgi:putative ABC transport system permease protein
MTTSTVNLDVPYADRLKKIEGVEDAIPVGRYFIAGKGGFGFEQIDGVDWNAYSRMNGTQIVEGQASSGLHDVMIDTTKAKNSNLQVGSVMKLFGNNEEYKVVGIYSPESGPRVKLTLAGLQAALEAPGKCTFVFVKLRNPDQVDAMAAKIDAELPGNTIQPTREVFAGFESQIPYLGIFLRVLVGLAAIVSALVVMLAMYTTITERTREIGILKAMGASRGYIVGIIEKEAILISFIGLVAGFGISALAGFAIHKIYGLVFEYSWQWAVTAAVIGLFGGILGALYPAWKASSLDPVNALAYD